jgi:hypothetical protein
MQTKKTSQVQGYEVVVALCLRRQSNDVIRPITDNLFIFGIEMGQY